MREEKIIEKIQKCLALANNNPSEEEAKAAALQAQKLIAKYNINMSAVEQTEENEIDEQVVWFKDCVKGVARAWKYQLAQVVADNFRCKCFFYSKSGVCFYGHKVDVTAACEVFKYLFNIGDKLANRVAYRVLREYHKRGESAQIAGIYNSFVIGFLAGLKASLEKQCTALMIVTPEDVKEGFAKRTEKMGKSNASMRNNGFNKKAYDEGHQAGKSALASRELDKAM